MTDVFLPPALIYIVGALFIPLFKGKTKAAYMLLLPVLAFLDIFQLPEGKSCIIGFLDYQLIFCRVDRLSLIFGYIFTLISFIGVIYSLHVKDDVQNVAAVIYAGSALGVTFAGDLFSLYIFWELLAMSSVFLVWARRTESSLAAGFRYILVHLFGGLCLLAGIVLYIKETGSPEFSYIGLTSLSTILIFIGFILNAALPPLHPWLVDAYPEATVTGAVFMSAFTTKSAVYILARTFPGTELLIWIGAAMTCFPIFYAVLENDIRRVLAYSLINQVGFMVCGIGIGTSLAINGAAAHAFCHILYKALLFMAAGAVLFRTGKIKCTDLGGLYKSMPLTAVFCMIGAASISAFPLFSGFVSKSMIISASAIGHLPVVWFFLQFASAGVFHHAGIKVPYFTFFSEDSGIRTKEAPLNMLIAMGIAAFLCVFIGIFPGVFLYKILPFPVAYVPYTAGHVIGQLELLMFAALAFTLLLLSGYYPSEQRAINLDTDWFYRKGAKLVLSFVENQLVGVDRVVRKVLFQHIPAFLGRFTRNPAGSIMAPIMQPYWKLRRIDKPKEEIYQAAQNIPIGIAVALATFILFYFSWAFIF